MIIQIIFLFRLLIRGDGIYDLQQLEKPRIMFGIINFEMFLIAGIMLNLTPGEDTMYIHGRSISQGKKAGILSAL